MGGNSEDDKRSDLIERARNGDQKAFVELVTGYEKMIHSIVRNFIRNIRDYFVNSILVVLHCKLKFALLIASDLAGR